MQNIIQIANGILIGGVGGGGGGVDPFVGLLDAYPGAAAAYSVRQLSSTYTAPTASEFSFGNALEFDGSNDYVDVGANLDPALANNFGFSCWFKTTSTTTVAARVADPFVGALSAQWTSAVGLNGGKITTMSYDGTVQQNEGSNTFNDGEWHCMTMLRTRGVTDILATASVWVDGVLELDAVNFNIISGGYKWEDLGVSRDPSEYADVTLDEMVFYQGVGLSIGLSENLSYYNNGNGALATSVFSDIYAYYRMNESGTDTTLTDETGNYNGTLNGFTVPGAWVNGKANNGALVEILRDSIPAAYNVFYSDANNELSLTSPDASGVTLGTWIGSNDGFVRTWYDQSGNGNNAMQTSVGSQPQIISGGVVDLDNLKPKIGFNGTSQYLEIPTSTATFNFLHNGTSCANVSISRCTDLSDVRSVWANNNSTGTEIGAGLRYRSTDEIQPYITNGSGTVVVLLSTTSTFNDVQSILFSEIDADNSTASDRWKLYQNAGSVINGNAATGTPTAADASNNMVIGARNNLSRYFIGNQQELIFWDSNQSANRTGIETNINNYYNIYSPPGAFMTATGGAIPAGTIVGDYKYHSFTSGTGTFEVTSLGSDPTYGDKIEYLIVAGGGGGGTFLGAGGGAGGLLTATNATVSATSYTATVGGGGAGATVARTKGGAGSNSTFYGLTAIGGGGGAANDSGQRDGVGGGSGGGAVSSGTPGAGTSGQGNEGGAGSGTGVLGQGGGGGAGAVGGDATSTNGGDGGVGLQNSITGTSVYYAGGGGGSAYALSGGIAGEGGEGGGGDGGLTAGSNADLNTGGGGGGSDRDTVTPAGGNGGSGIVIVRYKFQ